MISIRSSELNRPITWRDLLEKLPADMLDQPLCMHSGARDRESPTIDTNFCINHLRIDTPMFDGGPTIIEFGSRDETVWIIAGASEHVIGKG
jgi:hypothetical protein